MRKVFPALAALMLAGCLQNGAGVGEDRPYNQGDFAGGGMDAPELNERTMAFMQPGNPYSNVESFRPKSDQEKRESTDKWSTSRMVTRWQEYKGTMVRVEILLGDSDLREMRLKVLQNANGGDIDGDLRDILGIVADFEMKKVCGRRAESVAVVYDHASFEAMRPNPFFDYKVETEGSSMREYGFRCIYN
ncbi:MAG: hypothetical protein LBQ49_01565 [Rickettsiales bacterium]|jgi:hypothetical protein|nr:hypothetical protein [Rickettsiales bacterium]